MGWMYWTPPTAILFVLIGLAIAVTTAWELRSPCVPRRGFLPIVTTRGDRLFLGLLCVAYTNLAWAGLTDLSQWIGLALSLALFTLVGRRA